MRFSQKLIPVAVLMLAATTAPGADKKELAQVQRDIALLQDELRSSMKAQNDRLIALEATLRTVLDQINATNRAVTVLDGNLKSRVDNSVVKGMAELGSRMDAAQEDYRYVRETVAELNAKLGKISAQVADLNNVIRTMQAPPAPPATATPAAGPGVNAPPVGVTAESLYQDAIRDKQAGNSDIAMREFNDYLTWFGATDLAPNAQYYIGELYYNRKQFEEALKAFDTVLERYPKNAKTDDARFMKARSLIRLDRRSEGVQELRALAKENPRSELGRRAQTELNDLGLGATPSRTRKK